MSALVLTPDQQSASDDVIAWALDDNADSRIYIISGWAGCGKSTLTDHIILQLQKDQKIIKLLLGADVNDDLTIRTTATTNKAAKVLSEMLGNGPKTIQSLLCLRPVFNRKTYKWGLARARNYEAESNTIILIDEGSYINCPLLAFIIEASKTNKIIVVGDKYQVRMPEDDKDHPLIQIKDTRPPVFAMGYPESKLSTVKRNDGRIAELSTDYRLSVDSGIFPIIHPCRDIICLNDEQFGAAVDTHFTNDFVEGENKLISWSNERGNDYHSYIRDIRGQDEYAGVGEEVLTSKPIMSGKLFISTDTLVTIEEVSNVCVQEGVEGRYTVIKSHRMFWPLRQADAKKAMKKAWNDRDTTLYHHIKTSWLDLKDTHASTVHKAQGSSYQNVFIDLGDIGRCTIPTDFSRMMYTATSRAVQRIYFKGKLPWRYAGRAHL